MNHRRATELLPCLTAEALPSTERADLYRHVAACAECSAWIETRGLVASALSDGAWAGHPAGELLARSAVEAAPFSPVERKSLDDHLAVCEPCREARDLAVAALSSARGGEAAVAEEPSSGAGRARRLATAAALVLGLVLAFHFRSAIAPRGLGPSSSSSVAPADDQLTAPVERVVPRRESVAFFGIDDITIASGDFLAGTRRIDAGRSISATAVEIESGSEVTFSAGEEVVLGEGFEVGSDASFAIEIAPLSARSSRPRDLAPQRVPAGLW